jgi:hypothetical protein
MKREPKEPEEMTSKIVDDRRAYLWESVNDKLTCEAASDRHMCGSNRQMTGRRVMTDRHENWG